MTLGIIVAMDKEFSLLAEKYRLCVNGGVKNGCRFRAVLHDDSTIVLLQCGIGKVNAAIGTMTLINEFNVDVIISSGVAGGAYPDIEPNRIVVGESYIYHDVYCGKGVHKGTVQGEPSMFHADDQLLMLAKEMGAPDGTIVTGDQFIDSMEKMGAILDNTPNVIAVDMESTAIAQVCSKPTDRGCVPFISFRIISDCVMNPKAVKYEDFWNQAPHLLFNNTFNYVERVINEFKPL